MNRYFTVILPNSILIIFFVVIGNSLFAQTTLVKWDFNDGNLIADDGIPANQSKELATEGRAPILFGTSGTGASGINAYINSWSAGMDTKYWQIEFNSAGYDNITVSSKQRSSNFGPRDFKIQYKIGSGGTWTDFTGNTVPALADNWTSGVVANLTLPPEVDSQSSVFLRWVMTSNLNITGGGISGTGTSNIDDIVITGLVSAGSPTVNITSFSPTSGSIMRGTDYSELYSLGFEVTVANANFTNLTLTTGGTYTTSDIKTNGFTLWYSADNIFNSGSDAPLNSVNAISSGGNLIFSGFNQTINNGETGYIFLSVDISDYAIKDHTIFINPTPLSDITFTASANSTGTDPAPGSNTQTFTCLDSDSEILDTGFQPVGTTISSLANNASSSIEVIEFYIVDFASCDGLSTLVTNIRLQPNLTNTADWTDHIAGVELREQGVSTVTIDPVTITDSYIDIPIPSGNLEVTDGGQPIYEIAIYLNTNNTLVDGSILSFKIPYQNHGFTTDPSGTGFNIEFTSIMDIESEDFTVDVVATELEFVQQPVNTAISQPMASAVTVGGFDVHGNFDTDFSSQVSLTSSGSLAGSPLLQSATSGLASFTNVIHSTTGTGLLLTATSVGMNSGISSPFNITSLDEDFSSCPPNGWSKILISGNNWNCGSGYASISGIGGSSATEAWYLAPSINFSGLTNAVLSFDTWTSGTDISHPRLEVVYSTDYPGTGNPNIYSWTPLVFNLPVENSAVWTPSGIIDLSLITSSARIAFRYTSSGTSTGTATEWRIDNVAITENGCSAPTTPASNLTFTNVTSTSMTANWVSGNGTGRIVLAKLGSAVDQVPVDGTTYTANADFTLGEDIGGGNIIVFLGNGTSVDVINLSENTEYYYAVYEYNCDAATPVFNTTSPATGSQATTNPKASDIIVNSGFSYPMDIDYSLYQATSLSMTAGNSLGVFGLTLRDGGSTGNQDGLSTTLTSISFSTNSPAIRAAAVYDGTNLIGAVNVNGGAAFTIDLTTNPIVANDNPPPSNREKDFELRVTFMPGGENIVDNEQLAFTVTAAVAGSPGTGFTDPDAGGATSDASGSENVIRVDATSLNFVQVPTSTIIINSPFTIEVEAIDDNGARDLDKTLDISVISGTGLLSSASGLQKTTSGGTALWDDLIYDIEETGVQFQVADNPLALTPITTNLLNAKAGISVFTFTGANGDETDFSPDYQPNNLAIGNISRGSDLVPDNYGDAFNARKWSQASQPEDNFFYEFTITAEAGYDFSISSIELDHRRSSTGPPLWVVRSSVDNFTSNIDGFFSTPTDAMWFTNEEITFASSVTNQTAVTIRIYAYNAGGELGTWTIDNLYIFGTTRDIQAPEFTVGYPQSDSTALDGFDLIVNLNETATAYYVAQDPAVVLTAPDVSQVISGLNGDGVAAAVANTIDVTSVSTNFYERVDGLTSDNSYDVYYVLYDGTNYSPVILQTGIRTSDTNTDLVAAIQPVGPYEISSLATDAASAVNVFNFQVSDLGTADGAPTYVTKLVFNAGTNNTVTDWSTVIGGASLYNTTQATAVAVSNVTVNATSLEIDIAPGDLTIDDNSTNELALSIWLTSTVIDNEQLEFNVGGNPHSNTTYNIGSQFGGTLIELTSNIFTITVIADRLNISYYTPSITGTNRDIDLFVEATDINLNRDLDEISEVVVMLGQGPGAISANGAPPLNQNLIDGYIEWDNIRYDTNDDIITLIATSATLQDDTTGTIIVGSPVDLIVNGNFLLSSDLSVNNVIINDGGVLTITSGVTLGVAGNYTFNGTGTLVDQGATTVFNGGANVTQTITKIPTGTPERFYNIEVDQGNNGVLYNEMSIELINTLTMTSGDFYIDGASNDQDFTLISTSTTTARIGEMANGTSVFGQVTWHRSLRTGPQGWRYIGTPVKGQTLANISDDVWIQGIAERYPNAWTNIATYSEPLGTEGQNGLDGWIDFTSNTNPVNPGVGMKLWLWNSDYVTEQVIRMKGAPVIGSGDDGVASSGESYNFAFSFTPSSLGGGGWNFFANPYPSEIDWELVTQTDLSGTAVYIWNPTTQQYGTYSADLNTSLGGVTQYIASGQGFFVKANSGAATLSISEASKSTNDGNSFLRMSDDPLTKLMVEIAASNGRKDETAVAFTDFASNNYDPEFDAIKLAGGWVNLSTELDNDKLIAINAMGEKRGVQTVKLNIQPYVYGSYTMKFPVIEEFSEEAVIRLIDKYLNKTTYINHASSYAFNIDENNPETYGGDRFEIQFVEPASFRFDRPDAKAGREFVMPIFADKLADIMSANMTLSWDNEAITFVGIENAGLGDITDFDMSDVENGRLKFNDDRQVPLSLPDGSAIFSIRFKANNGVPQTLLKFERSSTNLKAIDNIDMPFTSEDVLINILQNRFVSGAITTFSGEFVNDVIVKAENSDEIIENISDLSGAYTLDAFEQSDYLISALKTDDSPLTDAVTTLDIIRTRRHLLRFEEFTSPYQSIAADVNGSNSITAIDLVEMRKVILGINPAFESGLNWLIIPEAYDLSSNPFSYQTSLDVSLGNQDLGLNFVGVKVGDVDNSWTNEGAARESNNNFTLSMENIILQDELVEIPVMVSEFADLRGYQFSITWDPNELEYYEIESGKVEGFFNEQMIDKGVLTTLWDENHGNAIELNPGELLFTLRFRVKDEDARSIVDINSSVTEAVAFDGKLNSMTISAVPANVILEDLRNGHLELFQNVPNPFDYTTQIEFKIAKPGFARFTIVNTLGELVYIHEQDYKAGLYSLSWDRSQSLKTIASGIYLYRLESNGEEVVKKMMIK